MPALLYLDASGAEREHPLTGDRISIGRLPDNGLVLNDTLVSRKHCVVERRTTGWVVRDEASRFGTFVNEHRVEGETGIRLGDIVRVGNTNMRFVDEARAVEIASYEESTGSMRKERPASAPSLPKDSIEILLGDARNVGEDLVKWIRDPNTVNLSGTPISTMIGMVDRIRRAEAVYSPT